MISVVMPTLNAEDTLARTLSALVPGVVEGLIKEVIVVDGGSQDATLEIADSTGCVIVHGDAERGLQLWQGCRAARGDPQGHRQTTSLPPPGPVQFAGQPGRRIGGDAGQGDVQSVGIDGVRTGQRGGGGQCGVTVGTSPGITAGIAGPGRHRQQQAGAAVRMKEGPFGRQMRAERDAAGQHRAIRSGGVQIREMPFREFGSGHRNGRYQTQTRGR